MSDDFSIEWISNGKKLPTLPGIAAQLLEAVNQKEPDIKSIAAIIANDPPLSAEILRFANSSGFGLRKPVTTVLHAAQMLGLKMVKNLALSFSLIKSFRQNGSSLDYSVYWRNSLTAAVSCRLIARNLLPDYAEDAFFLGLLHDIGVLILAEHFPAEYPDICSGAAALNADLAVREHEILGFNHMQVGRGISEKWGLPEAFTLPIGCHHCPSLLDAPSERDQTVARLLHLATLFVDFFNRPKEVLTLKAIHHYCDVYGFAGRLSVEDLLGEAGSHTAEVLPIFDIDGYDQDRYQELIEGARELLVQAGFEQVEELNRQQQEIEVLKQTAVRDGLTSLYNHKWFHEMLHREIQRSTRYGKPISVLLADIDDFKAINDRYGHLVGDKVLRVIAGSLRSDIRETDSIARYGGEEFGIICPETDLQGAINLGNRLIKSMNRNAFAHDLTPIPITLSIGIASLENGERLTREELIERADSALYTAKKTGKNRCCSYL